MTTRAQATAARRRQVLDAALHEFLEHGVERASIDDIRRRSGASIGSLYHHFGDKAGIAAALYLDVLADWQHAFISALEAADSTEHGIADTVRAHIDWLTGDSDRARYLLMHRDADTKLATHDALQELNAQFLARINAWRREHPLLDAPLPVIVALWIGPAQELARAALPGQPHWLTDAADTLAERACAAICP